MLHYGHDFHSIHEDHTQSCTKSYGYCITKHQTLRCMMGHIVTLTNWRQFLCVCPVIDHKFRHHIVKLAVDPQTTVTMLWRNSLSITGQTHKNWRQFVFYDNKLSNYALSLADASHEFQIYVSVRILTTKINQWARVNFCSYRKKSFSLFGQCKDDG